MPSVSLVRVPRYRATRKVIGLSPREEEYREYEQSKSFTKLAAAYEWVAWGFIFTRRRWDCECEGKFGKCCGETWKSDECGETQPTDGKPRCRYHVHDYCRRVVKRLARWLRWRDRRLAELNKEGPI